MAQKSKIGMNRMVSKRDKLYDQLVFNEKYPQVAAALIDEKHEKQQRQQELASKKRLYPMELAATPAGEANKALREAAMDEFVQKQTMSRRAVEQSARRMAKKSGEAAAKKFRAEKLGALDKSLEAFKAQLLAKYPDGAGTTASPAAVSAYRAAQEQEDRKMSELLAKCADEKKQKLAAINAKLDKENKRVRAAFDQANKALLEYHTAEAGEVADDLIMSLKNVKMYFSGIKAVDDLSFDIREGEIFGLIGPNGAGKSTLFNCITQFYKPTGGKIHYRDRFNHIIDLTHYKTHDVVKTGIARTFQNLEMVLRVSVLDNLLIGAHTYYRSGLFHQFLHTKRIKEEEQVSRALAMEVLERMDLLQYKDMPPAGLPYGVLKKIELARTLMTKPRLIILDEPAAGLNDAETEELTEIIKKIREDYKCTIFLVEHDMNLVMNVCDTVCAISFGKMLAIGTPEEIQENPLVQEAYLGEKEEDA